MDSARKRSAANISEIKSKFILNFQFSSFEFEQLTIWGNPNARSVVLIPNFLVRCGSDIVPMRAQTKKIDTILVAWVSVSGPLGNVVSARCKSTKLIEVQPIIAPCDTVNKFAAKQKVYFFSEKMIGILLILTAHNGINLTQNWPIRKHCEIFVVQTGENWRFWRSNSIKFSVLNLEPAHYLRAEPVLSPEYSP